MQLRKKLIKTCCTITILLLFFVNLTYCWESITQAHLGYLIGENTPADSDIPDTPEEPEKPITPDTPSDTEKAETPKEPSKDNQTTGEAQTGDTHEYLRYLCMMLTSFALMIVIGAALIVAIINRLEKQREKNKKIK